MVVGDFIVKESYEVTDAQTGQKRIAPKNVGVIKEIDPNDNQIVVIEFLLDRRTVKCLLDSRYRIIT